MLQLPSAQRLHKTLVSPRSAPWTGTIAHYIHQAAVFNYQTRDDVVGQQPSLPGVDSEVEIWAHLVRTTCRG